MHGTPFLRWFEPTAGVLRMLVVLADLFLTVRYARAGAGFISDQVARSTWAFFRWLAKALGRRRDVVMSLSGSVMVALVASWASILTVGVPV